MTDSGPPPDGAGEPEPGLVLRPEAVVLPDAALIPESNLLDPPPARLTHALTADEAYRLEGTGPDREPDGVLRAGTPVALVSRRGERCRVADAAGLLVEVPCASLRERPQVG